MPSLQDYWCAHTHTHTHINTKVNYLTLAAHVHAGYNNSSSHSMGIGREWNVPPSTDINNAMNININSFLSRCIVKLEQAPPFNQSLGHSM